MKSIMITDNRDQKIKDISIAGDLVSAIYVNETIIQKTNIAIVNLHKEVKYRKIWQYDIKTQILTSHNQIKSVAITGSYKKGALPKGVYTIKATTEIENCKQNESYIDRSGFAWWCAIKPTFVTNRSGLGIHPDGGIKGTIGCIGICDDYTRSIYLELKKSNNGLLIVT